MTDIEINPGEFEMDDVVIGTQPAGNTAISIVADPLAADIMDQVPPRMLALPPAVPVPSAASSDEEEEEDDGDEEEEEEERVPAPVPAPAPAPAPAPRKTIGDILQENPQFAKEFRKTAPPPPSAGKSSPAPEKKKKKRQSKPKKVSSPPPPVAAAAEEEAEEEVEEEEEEAEEDEEEEEKAPPPLSPQEEYIEKMRLMDEIKDFAKMGAMPPQPPNFTMPLDLLTKIRDYQASIIDETVGIGFIGMGWVGIIGLIESLNTRFDPFAKAFGIGLKLKGAKGEVEKNIHLYESTFKHIYRKLPKSKEAGPWVQLAVVTVQILTSVHKKNSEQEAREEVAKTLSDPEIAHQAEEFLRTHHRQKQQPAAPSSAPLPPPPTAQTQPPITPVESIVVSPVASDDEKETPSTPIQRPPPVEPIDKKRKEDEDVEEDEEEGEDDDDDDIIVQLPVKNKGKGK